ncbi:hypothetical protein CDAR_384821 [Caerostris darwini]|uniref:Uncharacterized protein n=1 Tax=Caerostris darwini TaxID=1538125 RepID=A0AAV4WCI5_9ARAC|nr:hypothetical protein CDAR_384821 [Caerostris darwini]
MDDDTRYVSKRHPCHVNTAFDEWSSERSGHPRRISNISDTPEIPPLGFLEVYESSGSVSYKPCDAKSNETKAILIRFKMITSAKKSYRNCPLLIKIKLTENK